MGQEAVWNQSMFWEQRIRSTRPKFLLSVKWIKFWCKNSVTAVFGQHIEQRNKAWLTKTEGPESTDDTGTIKQECIYSYLVIFHTSSILMFIYCSYKPIVAEIIVQQILQCIKSWISFLLRKIQEVRTILEYFRCMIGDTAEAWSCCSSKSDGYMLWVWFSCPFVPSKHVVKMTAPLEVCTEDKQHAIMRFFLVSEEIKWAETRR
jgi:hypothetical protein